MNVGFISLGCSKNLVDTEMAIGLFKNNRFTIVNDPKEADIIVVNTCGFIESAKEEAINTLLEMAEYKKKRCRYLIAMGCLVQRYPKELKESLPEVDLFLTFDEYGEFWEQIELLVNPKKTEEIKKNQLEYKQRVISTGNQMAYLKIAEGCSNHCTYCAIPSIRGPFISRKKEDIIEEAEQLAKQGIKELIVIAQDTTKYGIDLYGEPKLAVLLEQLCKIKGIEWIRFLYAYPESITDELIAVVKNNTKICHYFDIPIQHISDPVLKRMNRNTTGASIQKLIAKLREEIPDVIIRTTLMVGFPGETQENFQELYDFVKEAKLNKMGAFAYSKEEGTPAARLNDQVHPQTKKSRYGKIMQLQQQISREILETKIGTTYTVLVENLSFDGDYYIGRTYMDVPDMDGVVYIKNTKEGLLGKFITCKIIGVQEYDLMGEIVL